MSKIFAFCNQKGGVGKTTTAINLGAILSSYGYKVLLIDMDAQGNATSGLGQEKPGLESTGYQLLVDNESNPRDIIRKTDFENLFLIPSNVDLSGVEMELVSAERREYRLKAQLEKIKDDYDFIFIDCPPSLGLVTINSLVSSSYVMIPLQCEYYALEGLGQLLNTYQLVSKNLNPALEIGAVLLTMADLRTNLTHQVIEEVRSYFKDKVLDTIIPRSVKLSEAPSFGKPAVFYDAHNKASQAYIKAGEEFVVKFADKNLIPVTQQPEPEVPKEEESVPATPETTEAPQEQNNEGGQS